MTQNTYTDRVITYKKLQVKVDFMGFILENMLIDCLHLKLRSAFEGLLGRRIWKMSMTLTVGYSNI